MNPFILALDKQMEAKNSLLQKNGPSKVEIDLNLNIDWNLEEYQ